MTAHGDGGRRTLIPWLRMAFPELAHDPQVVGRYAVHEEIASGGMATVHLGRLAGVEGFTRAVAIKRLHPQLAKDPEFVSMLIDEARLAARVHHPNVVPTIEVVPVHDQILLVMEYIAGDSLANLLKAAAQHGERMPPEAAAAILAGVLHGLHAAHEATSEGGKPLGIVHRDVSPQNILVGVDGIARVLDFGIAKAAVRLQTTRDGQLKGKLRYMAPEQLRGEPASRQIDIYSAGVVLWEALTSERLFAANNDAALFGKVLEGVVSPPSRLVPGLPRALDEAVLRALDRRPEHRFATAQEMALALTSAVRAASVPEVSALVQRFLGPELARRQARVTDIERGVAGVIPTMDRTAPSAKNGTAVDTVTNVSGPVTETITRGPALAPSAAEPATPHEMAPAAPHPMDAPAAAPANASWSRESSVPTLVRAQPDRRRILPAMGGAAWGILGAALLASAAGGVVWQRAASSGVNTTESNHGAMTSAAISLSASPTAEAAPVAPQSTIVISEAPPPATEVARKLGRDETRSASPSSPPPGGRLGAPLRAPSMGTGGAATAASAANAAGATNAAKPNCNPPYVEDATGIRRVKRECL